MARVTVTVAESSYETQVAGLVIRMEAGVVAHCAGVGWMRRMRAPTLRVVLDTAACLL